MPGSYLDPTDLIIPAFDSDAKTSHLEVDIHPGQARILDYLAACDGWPFRSREDAARFCICFGTHSLLGPLPNVFTLVEAKMNILQDERFERQKDCLAESVQKYLAAGDKESARRLVTLSFEEYSRIPNQYFRFLWLSTLSVAIEMLRQHGIPFSCSESTNQLRHAQP